MNIQHILVPTDFSDNANEALRYATHIAKKLKANITLLHTYHLPNSYVDTYVPQVNLVEEFTKEAEKQIKNLETKVPQLNELAWDHIIEPGFVVDSVINTTIQKQIDFIVMGTKGSSNTLDTLLGTNASAVIRKSSVPVLAIPEETKEISLNHFALASDFQPLNDTSKFLSLVELAKLFNAKITILNITEEAAQTSIDEAMEALNIYELMKDVPHQFEFITSEDTTEGINQFIDKNNVDLLAMIPAKHDWLERLLQTSITKKMVLHTKVPLLALK